MRSKHLPVARRAADAAVDHEFLGPLGHRRVEVVHEHAQRRFGEPALRRESRAGGGADDARGVGAVHAVLRCAFAKAMQASRMSRSATRSVAACASSSGAGQLCSVERALGFVQVAAHGKLHLHRVDAHFAGLP